MRKKQLNLRNIKTIPTLKIDIFKFLNASVQALLIIFPLITHFKHFPFHSCIFVPGIFVIRNDTCLLLIY